MIELKEISNVTPLPGKEELLFGVLGSPFSLEGYARLGSLIALAICNFR